MKKIILLITFLLLIIQNSVNSVYAIGINKIEEFDNLSGDAQYVAEEYAKNYRLDIEPTGMLETGEKLLNEVANILLIIISNVAYIVVVVFYHSMSLDIAALFSTQIDAIQGALRSSVFVPLFTLAFSASAFSFIKQLYKRNFSGLIGDIAKVIFIFLLSYFVVSHSADTLSGATNITKDISIRSLKSINNPADTSLPTSFAADSAGLIWQTLVHNVWLALEFNSTNVDEETVKKFLTENDSAKRVDLVKDYRDSVVDKSVMSKSSGIGRIGFLVVYLIPFLVNSAIYLIISVIQLGFQLMAVFFVLLAPVILILALVPAMGGFDLISSWAKKILETQLSILIITFLLGLLLKLNRTLYDLSATYGWFVIIVIQTLIAVIVVLNRDKILKALSGINKMQSNPGMMKSRLRNSGNLYQSAGSRNNGRKKQSNVKNRISQQNAPQRQATYTLKKDRYKTKNNVADVDYKETKTNNNDISKKPRNLRLNGSENIQGQNIQGNQVKTIQGKNTKPNNKNKPVTKTRKSYPEQKNQNFQVNSKVKPRNLRLNGSENIQGQNIQDNQVKTIQGKNTKPNNENKPVTKTRKSYPEQKNQNFQVNSKGKPRNLRLNGSENIQGQNIQDNQVKTIQGKNTKPNNENKPVTKTRKSYPEQKNQNFQVNSKGKPHNLRLNGSENIQDNQVKTIQSKNKSYKIKRSTI